MEKLRIEHIAIYLTHGVEFIDKFVSFGFGEYRELNIHTMCNCLGGGKLILKPLSQLESIAKEQFIKFRNNEDHDAEIIDLFCFENIQTDDLLGVDYNKLPYECIVYMAKHHYDFQDLISKGLAIDINTLNNRQSAV